MIKITIEMLKKKEACLEGIKEFEKIFGLETKLEWTKEKQIELFKTPLCKYIMWAVNKGIIPLWSMAGANMAGANMAGADMTDADMARANMAGADMANANMARANMAGANMARANMAGADMTGAHRPENDMQKWGWIANKDGYLEKM